MDVYLHLNLDPGEKLERISLANSPCGHPIVPARGDHIICVGREYRVYQIQWDLETMAIYVWASPIPTHP